MKEKITTKTIIIGIIALLVLGAAIASAVIFLKDSGEVSATGNIQNATLIEAEKNQSEEKNEQLPENANIQNKEEINENKNTNINTITNNNNFNEKNNASNTKNQDEPAPTTVERERIVSENTTLGWSNIGFNSEINNLEINYNNIEYSVEYYFDGKLVETSKISGNQKNKEITSYEDKTKEGYTLDKVENLPLVISEKEDENVIRVYYKKASYGYTVFYYKDSIDGRNFLGRMTGTAEFEATVTADTTKFIPNNGYVFNESSAPSMIISTDSKTNILNVIYKKVNNLSYTINYLEKGTNKELQAATVVANQEFNKVVNISDITIPNTLTYNSKEYTYSNKFSTNQEPLNKGKIIISTDLSLNIINLYYERPEIKAQKTSTIVTNATQSGKAYPGDEITYTIKVWNEGSGDKQVKIEDTEPNGTTIISNSEIKNYGNVLTKNGKITWIVNVPANTTINNARTLTFKVKINDNASGTIKNTAKLDGNDGPNDGNGYSIIKPADIIVSKESKIIDTNKNGILEYGEKIVYTIKATNNGDDVGTVTIKDKDLKTLIDNDLIELLEKTGYTGTNQQLVDDLAGNGIKLAVQGNSAETITYTVKVIANAGKTIKNSIEVIDGKVDDNKKETTNTVEKIATKTENTETIKGKNIVIAIDLSASMNDIINGTDKLEAAKDAAQQFINKIFENDPNGTSGTKLSIVTFNYSEEDKNKDECRTDTNPKYVGTKVFTYGKNNKTIVTNKKEAQEINTEIEKIKLEANLGTNIGAGLIKSQQQVNTLKANNNNESVIILLGDGRPETGGNENTETAINQKAMQIKNAGTEIYTIGFGLHAQVDRWCPVLFNLDCEKSHYYKGLLRYHKEDVYDTEAIRILKNIASGKTNAEKDKYAKSSSNAQSLINTFEAISKDIAISSNKSKSSNGKIELASTIYADNEHPITIKVNGKEDTKLTVLPTDVTGKVIKENGKYYLDLTKFKADAEVSITYFSK